MRLPGHTLLVLVRMDFSPSRSRAHTRSPVRPPPEKRHRSGGFDEDFLGGGADLRFHKGGYTAKDFPFLPLEPPTPIRIDLPTVAAVIPEGGRLLVKLSGGGEEGQGGFIAALPLLTIHGGTGEQASHLVLPLIGGSFGGDAPTVAYPERPFSD